MSRWGPGNCVQPSGFSVQSAMSQVCLWQWRILTWIHQVYFSMEMLENKGVGNLSDKQRCTKVLDIQGLTAFLKEWLDGIPCSLVLRTVQTCAVQQGRELQLFIPTLCVCVWGGGEALLACPVFP